MKGRMSHAVLERKESARAEAKESREEGDAEHCRGGRVKRKHGGHVGGKTPAQRLDKRARGGKFIAEATEHSHGQFRAKAEKAGKSTLAYAHEHDEDKGKTGKQARLAEVLIKAGKHQKKG